MSNYHRSRVVQDLETSSVPQGKSFEHPSPYKQRYEAYETQFHGDSVTATARMNTQLRTSVTGPKKYQSYLVDTPHPVNIQRFMQSSQDGFYSNLNTEIADYPGLGNTPYRAQKTMNTANNLHNIKKSRYTSVERSEYPTLRVSNDMSIGRNHDRIPNMDRHNNRSRNNRSLQFDRELE